MHNISVTFSYINICYLNMTIYVPVLWYMLSIFRGYFQNLKTIGFLSQAGNGVLCKLADPSIL